MRRGWRKRVSAPRRAGCATRPTYRVLPLSWLLGGGSAGKAEAARRPLSDLCGDAIQHGYDCVFLHQVNSRWMIHSCAFAHNYTKKLLRLKDTFYQFFYQFFGGLAIKRNRRRGITEASIDCFMVLHNFYWWSSLMDLRYLTYSAAPPSR